MSTFPTNDNFFIRGLDSEIHVVCARCDSYSEVFCLPRGTFETIRVAMETHDAAHEVIDKARRGESISAVQLETLVDDFEPRRPE